MDSTRVGGDGVCEGRLWRGGGRMESGSVQIYSWHFDTRDRELAVGTAARMWNYGSLCSGHQVGDVGVGVGGEGFRRRRCGL